MAKQLGLDKDIDDGLATVDAERQQLQDYRQRHNVQSLRPFRSVRDAALRYGRGEDYWLYEWSHESVHGTDAAWLFARKKVSNDAMGFHAKTDDPLLRASFAGFSATSITDATVATFSIFGWQLPEDFRQPADEIEQLLQAAAG